MTDTISLRTATAQDIGTLDRLFQRSYMALLRPFYPPSTLVVVVPGAGRAHPDLIASGRFFIAEQDGRVLGAGGWSLDAPGGRRGTPGIGHVRQIAVEPFAIRRGIGRLILRQVFDETRALGLDHLQCRSTLQAVPFYEAMGFVRQADTVVALRGGIDFPVVSMMARLREG